MKHGSFRAMCLVLMAGIAVATAFGDERALVLEAKVMDTFDEGAENPYGPLEWKIEGSKFSTKKDAAGEDLESPFPRLLPIKAYPQALVRPGSDTDTSNMRVLGINSSFTRRGYNWIDVYPEGPDNAEKGIGFDIPGRIRYIDMWVWGSNLNYSLEAYFRDYNGLVRTVNMGSLAYEGWKNLQVPIPANFPQTRKVLPYLTPLRFLKFRIWTSPTEIVDQLDPTDPHKKIGVYVYFDNLRILTDTFEGAYDGEELADRKTVGDLWSNN
ncbi:MAG: flagellar filament outer layer protein FlaA [Treponema sp.]|jgi:hypothetical protein|nr:flagellar filament outer layer protein FlaA [Treponema sp.]